MATKEEIQEVRRYIRRINASLRVYQNRGYSNPEQTAIYRADQAGLVKKRNAKGNIYYSEATKDIEWMLDVNKRNISFIKSAADRSTLSYYKEQMLKSGDLKSINDASFHEKLRRSDYITNFIKDNLGTLYVIDAESHGHSRASRLLNMMDRGTLDIDQAYEIIMKMERRDRELLDSNEAMFHRSTKYKKSTARKLI